MHSVCTKSSELHAELLRNHVARGTRIQLGRNGSETTTDKGAPDNSSAATPKYTPSARRQAPLSHGLAETAVPMKIAEEYKKVLWTCTLQVVRHTMELWRLLR
jgi:hypothetical protein